MQTMEELRKEIRKNAETMKSMVCETTEKKEPAARKNNGSERSEEESGQIYSLKHQMADLVHDTIHCYRQYVQKTGKLYPDEQLYESTLKMLLQFEKTVTDMFESVSTFISAPENDILSETAVLSSMYRLEYDFYSMSAVLCPDVPGNVKLRSQVIPIVCSYDVDGIITISLKTELPHIKTRYGRLTGIYDKIMGQAFLDQVKRLPDSERFERAYIILEHHTDRTQPDTAMRDCDNYDTKHLIDLLALYFLKKGDGPYHVRVSLSCVPDNDVFTRAYIVKPEAMEKFIQKKMGFYSWL